MNIVCRKTSHCDKDPFDASDRNWNTGAGKGDAPRNLGPTFQKRFDEIDRSGPNYGRVILKKNGRTVYRFS